jgi:light-regulated signal transduction histidine kinase (bacteriophytochrome)
LRARPEFAATPVVILTAKADDDFRLRLLREGANDYVMKPIALEELRVRVRTLVNGKLANDHIMRLNTELRAANAELDAFSASASHDLRAPLRAIEGFCRLLQEEHSHSLSAAGLDYLRRIRAASDRMRDLIEDLLQLARVGRSQINIDLVDLSELARTTLAALQATEPNRKVAVAIAPELVAAADAHLIRIVLENLFGNAWKFTKRSANAQIEMGAFREEDALVFFVRDNGAGFDMTYAQKLFQPFERLHAYSDFPGTGVGLATVERIVQRHGGRIWARAEPGRGATIYWTLPSVGVNTG